MKFSTGNKFAVLMTTPVVSRKTVVTYETESEAVTEAQKAQERVRERGYTDVHYTVEAVGA